MGVGTFGRCDQCGHLEPIAYDWASRDLQLEGLPVDWLIMVDTSVQSRRPPVRTFCSPGCLVLFVADSGPDDVHEVSGQRVVVLVPDREVSSPSP